MLTHQLHPCNLSPVGATDHSTRRVLKNALEADHVNMAVLLRAHGGILGPVAAPDLIGTLDKPDVPSVRDVKWKINRLMRQQVTLSKIGGLAPRASQEPLKRAHLPRRSKANPFLSRILLPPRTSKSSTAPTHFLSKKYPC